MTQTYRRVCFVCFVVIAFTLIGLALNPALAEALPPRPEPEATETPSPTPDSKASDSRPDGGYIELNLQFPSGWPWHTTHWQELWTTVQWQHPDGSWRDVEGWRGTLDDIAIEENDAVMGQKRWWVSEDHLGQGPFRWVIALKDDDALLAASDPFLLPAAPKRTTTVEVALTP